MNFIKVFLAVFLIILIPVIAWRIGYRNIAEVFDFRVNHEAAWSIKSIDTMKYSRDLARHTLSDKRLQEDIEVQVEGIAKTGATHVAIGTPYDEEFLPVLKLWVRAARKNNLHVFFRGNFAGWEGWFGSKKITRKEHTEMAVKFIEDNSEIFVDGDIFSSCPECENGEKLDMNNAIQIESYRSFLVRDYKAVKQAFRKINKNIASNYYSMNGDVAKRVMDRKTTAFLDGLVVIDHYVKDPSILARDVRTFAQNTGGKVMLGEIGAPIPTIHGQMSEKQQAEWIEDAFEELSDIPEVVGVNYWVNIGGSSGLWHDSTHPKQAVGVITKFYTEEKRE